MHSLQRHLLVLTPCIAPRHAAARVYPPLSCKGAEPFALTRPGVARVHALPDSKAHTPYALTALRHSGYGIAESLNRRGLLEDTRLGMELAVTAVFEAVRTAIRALLLLPRLPQQAPAAALSSEVGRRPWGGSGGVGGSICFLIFI